MIITENLLFDYYLLKSSSLYLTLPKTGNIIIIMKNNIKEIAIVKKGIAWILIVLFILSCTSCSKDSSNSLSCPACGSAISESANFCAECGYDLSANDAPDTDIQPDAEKIPETGDISASPSDNESADCATASLWDGSIATSYESGNGTPESPYEIANASQLAFFAQEVNEGRVYHGQYYILSNNIVLNESKQVRDYFYADKVDIPLNFWTPIGTKSCPFEAEFDGNSHTITGLAIDSYENLYAGLFGYVTNASIRNITLDSAFIYAPSCVGGIAGYVEPTGNNAATFEYCSVDNGSLWSRGGFHFEEIYSSYEGDLSLFTSGSAGGIAGYAYAENGSVYLYNCLNGANVISATTQSYIDTLCQTYDIDSYDYIVDTHDIGGILGCAYTEDDCYFFVEKCVNLGEIESHFDNNYVGGIVGITDSRTCVANCINAGIISGAEGKYGSIVGYENSDYEDGGYVINCWYDPEYCAYDCAVIDDDSFVDIQVTAKENLLSMDWLYANLYFDPARWSTENSTISLLH